MALDGPRLGPNHELMKKPVDLYDSHYEKVEAGVYRAVCEEAFGKDLGQTSWITAAECDEFCRWLDPGSDKRVLEVACGSGAWPYGSPSS